MNFFRKLLAIFTAKKENPQHSSEEHPLEQNNDKIIYAEELSAFVEEGIYGYYRHIPEDVTLAIPEGVRIIKPRAFDHIGLKKIIIPESVRVIGARAFADNDLKEVVIPEGVTAIGHFAFGKCYNLEHVSIPKSVVYIGAAAFQRTAWAHRQEEEHGLVIVNHILISCSYYLTDELVVPSTVRSISDGAFDFPDVTSITIPESVTYIAAGAFYRCPRLESIIYHGILFHTKHIKFNINFFCPFYYIDHKILSMSFRHHEEYYVIFRMFCANPEDAELLGYVQEHSDKMAGFLDEEISIGTWQKILNFTQIVTKENIDMLIHRAIDLKETELQIMLMNYKAEKIGYEDTEEAIRKKFSL